MIPDTLSQLISDDFNGDGHVDLAGLASLGGNSQIL